MSLVLLVMLRITALKFCKIETQHMLRQCLSFYFHLDVEKSRLPRESSSSILTTPTSSLSYHISILKKLTFLLDLAQSQEDHNNDISQEKENIDLSQASQCIYLQFMGFFNQHQYRNLVC